MAKSQQERAAVLGLVQTCGNRAFTNRAVSNRKVVKLFRHARLVCDFVRVSVSFKMEVDEEVCLLWLLLKKRKEKGGIGCIQYYVTD